jgi:hypothetical protein
MSRASGGSGDQVGKQVGHVGEARDARADKSWGMAVVIRRHAFDGQPKQRDELHTGSDYRHASLEQLAQVAVFNEGVDKNEDRFWGLCLYPWQFMRVRLMSVSPLRPGTGVYRGFESLSYRKLHSDRDPKRRVSFRHRRAEFQ